MHSLREQYCHFFLLSACDATYLYWTRNVWEETRFLKIQRRFTWDWLVGRGWEELFPWKTTPLFSLSTTAGEIAPWYEAAAACSRSCIITPLSISPRYDPTDVNILAHVHLHWTFAMVQYIKVAAEEMIGESYSQMIHHGWLSMIVLTCLQVSKNRHHHSQGTPIIIDLQNP